MPNERVVALLYLLMRDHLPVGKVDWITGQLGTLQKATFSNAELEATARRLAARLDNDKARS